MARPVLLLAACILAGCVYDLSRPMPDSSVQGPDRPVHPIDGPDGKTTPRDLAPDLKKADAAGGDAKSPLPRIEWVTGNPSSPPSCIKHAGTHLVSGGGSCLSPAGLTSQNASPLDFSATCSADQMTILWAACGDFDTAISQGVATMGKREAETTCELMGTVLVGGTCACSEGTIAISSPWQTGTIQSWRCACTSEAATATVRAICSTLPVVAFETVHWKSKCNPDEVLLAGGCACALNDRLQASSYVSTTAPWECTCVGGATTILNASVICARPRAAK